MKFGMKFFFALAVLVTLNSALAQTVLYQERFPNGNPEISWIPADGVSQLRTTTRGNISGDNTVGFVSGVADFGNTGQIISGSAALKNYKIEAQVFLTRAASAGSGTNNGIIGRFIPLDQTFKCYLLNSDFDSNNRLRLRKFTGATAGTPPTVVRDWGAAEIPGGIPAVSGWHKLALDFQGNQISAYFDGQLLPGSPFTDSEADSGYFGVYCFVGGETAQDTATYFDDVLVTGAPTSVEDNPITGPATFELLQNYPNPFNPATTISFSLASSSLIQLDVYNLIGQKVATIASGLWPAGDHGITWQANGLPGGVYLARLQSNGQTQTKRLVLTK